MFIVQEYRYRLGLIIFGAKIVFGLLLYLRRRIIFVREENVKVTA